MNYSMPHISRRMIGKVNIFDLSGEIQRDFSHGVAEYLKSYIKECHLNNVVLNIDDVKQVDKDYAHEIMDSLKMSRKRAIYTGEPEKAKTFTETEKRGKETHICKTQKEILEYFGSELVEKDKVIAFTERRQSERIKTALEANITFRSRDGKKIESEGIVTNMSRDGIFAEYFNPKTSFEVDHLDFFKNLVVTVDMQNPDLSSQNRIVRTGRILRIEFTGAQVGVAIEFD